LGILLLLFTLTFRIDGGIKLGLRTKFFLVVLYSLSFELSFL